MGISRISNHPLVYSWLDPYLHLIFYTGFVLFCASFMGHMSVLLSPWVPLHLVVQLWLKELSGKWYCRKAIAKVSLWMGLTCPSAQVRWKQRNTHMHMLSNSCKRSLRFYEVNTVHNKTHPSDNRHKFVCQKKDLCMTVRPGRLQIPLSNRYLPNKYLRNG